MMGVSSGCGLCPWSCSGKVGAYVLQSKSTHSMMLYNSVRVNNQLT